MRGPRTAFSALAAPTFTPGVPLPRPSRRMLRGSPEDGRGLSRAAVAPDGGRPSLGQPPRALVRDPVGTRQAGGVDVVEVQEVATAVEHLGPARAVREQDELVVG